MKRIVLLGGALALTACGKGNFENQNTQAAGPGSACEIPQSEFTADTKVLISTGLNAAPGAATSPNSLMIGALEAPNLRGKGDAIVARGTRLEVILKNQCRSDGEITRQIRRRDGMEEIDGVTSYSFVLDRDMKIRDLNDLAREDECVHGISEEDLLVESAAPNDPYVSRQTQLKFIQADSKTIDAIYAPAFTNPGDVVIAVIDSGTDLAHPDLKNVLWRNPREIAGNGKDDDRNGFVDDVYGYNFARDNGNPKNSVGKSHGTHVAGLAAAQGYNGIGGTGIIPRGAKIMSLNIFGSSDAAISTDVSNAIRYAVRNGAKIINMSIAGADTAGKRDAIAYAIKNGVTLFGAAGNDGRLLGSNFSVSPAIVGKSYNGLLTIGSISPTTGDWTSYSNYSSTYVELASPGQSLYSTMPGGGYGYKSGTSMATPVAAGAGALAYRMIKARGYNPTPARIELALKRGAYFDSSLRSKVDNGAVLNLGKLVAYIKSSYPILKTIEKPADSSADLEPPPTTEVTVPCL